MKSTSSSTSTKLSGCFFSAFSILGALFFTAKLNIKPEVSFLLLLSCGWLAWTFVEYFIHRFLMHELIVPGSRDKLFNHEEHHKNPTHIHISPLQRFISISLSVFLILLAIYLNNNFTIFAGFFLGLTTYQLIHYLLHQRIAELIIPRIQRAHILHHSIRPNCGYSFSTILWDWLFGTLPPDTDRVTDSMVKRYFEHESKLNKAS